jgi:hypothetical protein
MEQLIDQRLAPMLVSHRTHRDKSPAGVRALAVQRRPEQTPCTSVSGCGVGGGFQGLGAVLAESCPSTPQGAGAHDSAGSRSGLPADKTQTVPAWLASGNSSAAPATVSMEAAPAVASVAASPDGPAGNGSGVNTRGGPSRPCAGAGSRFAMLDRGVDTVRAGPAAAAAGDLPGAPSQVARQPSATSSAVVGGAEAGSVRGSDGGGGGGTVGRGAKRLPTPAGGGCSPGSARAPSAFEADWAGRAGFPAVGLPLLIPLPVLRHPRRTRRADAGVRGEAGRSPEKDSEQK